MSFELNSQYRYQYSSKNHSQMAWQPTSIWRSNRRRLVSSPAKMAGWIGCFLFFVALLSAFATYILVDHLAFIRQMRDGLHGPILIGITMTSFAITIKILFSDLVKSILGFVISSIFVFCVAVVAAPFIWHLL